MPGKKRVAAPQVAWTPDGRGLVARCARGYLRVEEIATGRALHSARAMCNVDLGLYWSPDADRLATVLANQVFLWTVGQKTPTLTYDLPPLSAEAARIGVQRNVNLAWSPDGRRIATAIFGTDIRVWDAATGREQAVYQWDREAWAKLAWSPAGDALVSIANPGLPPSDAVVIWQATTGRVVRALDNAGMALNGLLWTRDARWIVGKVCGISVVWVVWEAATGAIRAQRPLGTRYPFACSPDGRHLAAFCVDGRVDGPARGDVAFYALPALTLTAHQPLVSDGEPADGSSGRPCSLAWSPDGRALAIGFSGGRATIIPTPRECHPH